MVSRRGAGKTGPRLWLLVFVYNNSIGTWAVDWRWNGIFIAVVESYGLWLSQGLIITMLTCLLYRFFIGLVTKWAINQNRCVALHFWQLFSLFLTSFSIALTDILEEWWYEYWLRIWRLDIWGQHLSGLQELVYRFQKCSMCRWNLVIEPYANILRVYTPQKFNF